MKIIYNTTDGTIAVITPSPRWVGTMDELAQKDVPSGLKYKIVEDSEVPSDRTFRNAWEANTSDWETK
jgi:hypothetical protein